MPERAIKTDHLSLLMCPACNGSLDIQAGSQEPILACNSCKAQYPVDDGVPRFIKQSIQGTSSAFGFQWNAWMEGSLEKEHIYGIDLQQEIEEFHKYTGVGPELLQGKRILDAGCGSGRLTKYLASKGATVIGLDVHDSLGKVSAWCAEQPGVLIVQGDILAPPLKKESFDIVWSEGVIHHTKDASAAADRLAALVKPGGLMFLWVYWEKQFGAYRIYRFARNTMKVGHKLPMPVLFSICRVLGYLLFAAAWVRALPSQLTGKKKVSSALLHTHRFFDHISPKYNTQHSEAEVRGWFERNGFFKIERVSDLGMRGCKTPTA